MGVFNKKPFTPACMSEDTAMLLKSDVKANLLKKDRPVIKVQILFYT